MVQSRLHTEIQTLYCLSSCITQKHSSILLCFAHSNNHLASELAQFILDFQGLLSKAIEQMPPDTTGQAYDQSKQQNVM